MNYFSIYFKQILYILMHSWETSNVKLTAKKFHKWNETNSKILGKNFDTLSIPLLTINYTRVKKRSAYKNVYIYKRFKFHHNYILTVYINIHFHTA